MPQDRDLDIVGTESRTAADHAEDPSQNKERQVRTATGADPGVSDGKHDLEVAGSLTASCWTDDTAAATGRRFGVHLVGYSFGARLVSVVLD
jgi:hypothetical protein